MVMVAAASLTVLLGARMARAELTIKWDCYLPGGAVDCSLLENSLTAKIPFVRSVSDPRTADVVVSVTSVSA